MAKELSPLNIGHSQKAVRQASSEIFTTQTDFIAKYAPISGILSDACAAYGTGPVWIAGQQYWCDGSSLNSVGGGVGGGNTNLTIGTVTANTVTINSDTGTDAIIPAATQSSAGVLTAADKTALDSISGSISSAIAAHNAASDPHPGYTTAAELSSAISSHEAASDPHPGYTTASELTAALSALTKSSVGLGNVDNTSDASKPVSTATQTALNGKASSTHTHVEADISGLTTALAGKVPESLRNQPNGFAGLDNDGNLVGTIIPRTGTLETLTQLVGEAGEVASATDTSAIVKFNGVSAPGDVFYKDGFSVGTSAALKTFRGFNAGGSAMKEIVTAPFYNLSATRIFGVVNAAGTSIRMSYDGINYFKVDAHTTPGLLALCDNTLVNIPIAAGTTAYKSASPYSTWTAITGAIADTSTTMGQPVQTLEGQVLSVAVGSNNRSALINVTGDAAYQVTMPSVQSWKTPVTTPTIFSSSSSQFFAVSVVNTSNKVATFEYDDALSQKWVARDLPAATVGTTLAALTDSKLLIASNGTSTAYLAEYYFDLGQVIIGAWKTIQLPATPYTLVANTKAFCFGSAGSDGIYFTEDCLTWKHIDTDTTPVSKLVAASWGFVAYAGRLYYIADNGSYVTGPTNTQYSSAAYQVKYGDVSITGTTPAQTLLTPNSPQIEEFKDGSTSTSAILIPVRTTFYDLRHTTTTAALTVNLPPNPYDGQVLTLRANAAITTLTIGTQAAPASQTVMGGSTWVTSMTAGQVRNFIYSLTNNAWASW